MCTIVDKSTEKLERDGTRCVLLYDDSYVFPYMNVNVNRAEMH